MEQRCLGCMRSKDASATVCPYCGYDASVPTPKQYLQPGAMLSGKYLIGSVIGHGGFGITYLGWDTVLNIKLAIKEYLPQDCASRVGEKEVAALTGEEMLRAFQTGKERFLEEARTLARFDGHQNIVGVRDFFRENGTAYLVMSYLDGVTLKAYLLENGPLRWKQALNIMLPVMDALLEVHQAGVLHRDVSPDNIIITTAGQVKVIDFGAARQSTGQRSISIIAKAGYAPEEQYRTHGNQGPWTDVYATAATLYRVITGKVPPQSLDRLARDTLTPPSSFGADIPDYAERALIKAMSVRAQDRYQSVAALKQALTGGAPAQSYTRVPYPAQQLQQQRPAQQPRPRAQGSKRPAAPARGNTRYTQYDTQPRKRKASIAPMLVATLGMLMLVGLAIVVVMLLDGSIAPPGAVATATPSASPARGETAAPTTEPTATVQSPSETPAPDTPPPEQTPAPPLDVGNISSVPSTDYAPPSNRRFTYTGPEGATVKYTGNASSGAYMCAEAQEQSTGYYINIYYYKEQGGALVRFPDVDLVDVQTVIPATPYVGQRFQAGAEECEVAAVNLSLRIGTSVMDEMLAIKRTYNGQDAYYLYARNLGLYAITYNLEHNPQFVYYMSAYTILDETENTRLFDMIAPNSVFIQ